MSESQVITIHAGKQTIVPTLHTLNENTLMGKVVSLDGAPLSNIRVLVDGIDTTTTDAEGVYFLARLDSLRDYLITAENEHFEFDPVRFTISEPSEGLQTTELPDIQATATYICGKVHLLSDEEDTIEYFVDKRDRNVTFRYEVESMIYPMQIGCVFQETMRDLNWFLPPE